MTLITMFLKEAVAMFLKELDDSNNHVLEGGMFLKEAVAELDDSR